MTTKETTWKCTREPTQVSTETALTQADKRLVSFLRTLANSIEREELHPNQMQSIGEFFMSYQFQEQAIRDNDTSGEDSGEDEEGGDAFSDMELIKFIILGWYVYCCILRGDTVKGEKGVNDLD